MDRIFRALADRTRRDIVRRTLVGEVTVSQLASGYDMSFAAVQKHVAVLEGAGLITKHPHGRERLVRGNPETIRRAQALLDQFEALWRDRVARLDALLADDIPDPLTPPHAKDPPCPSPPSARTPPPSP